MFLIMSLCMSKLIVSRLNTLNHMQQDTKFARILSSSVDRQKMSKTPCVYCLNVTKTSFFVTTLKVSVDSAGFFVQHSR